MYTLRKNFGVLLTYVYVFLLEEILSSALKGGGCDTNYCKLNSHLHKVVKKDTPETAKHIIKDFLATQA